MKYRVGFYLFILGFTSNFFLQAATTDWLITWDAEKRVTVPKADLGDTWRTDISFDDGEWQPVSGIPGGIGYEMDTGYETYISLDVSGDMHDTGTDPNTSCYVRIKFDLTAEQIAFTANLILEVWYDDGFVAYLNGDPIADALAPTPLKWDTTATGNHEAVESEVFVITQYKDLLQEGQNLLAIHALNVGTGSSDFLINAALIASDEQVEGFSSSNLPIIVIDTHGQSIPNDYRITADMGIIYNGPGVRNNLSDPWNDYNGKIDIEIRGSTSAGFPKKPYRIETVDSLGNNLNVSLLGMPRENDWVLHNPYSDKSLLRNVLACKISNDIGAYASRTRLCELVLNYEYQGVYVLMEKIKRDNDRVNIAETDSNDVAGDSLTGGYILKLDKTDGEDVGGWGSDHGVFYQYHYPKPRDILPQQENYIQNFMQDFEDIFDRANIDDYLNVVDLQSFVDHFIVNEISRNIDAYRLSAYMYKDSDSRDGRLTMGPVWDFNLSFGNGDYYDGWQPTGWNLDHLIENTGGDFSPPFWWEPVRNDKAFLNLLSQRWWTLRQTALNTDVLLNYIDFIVDSLDEAQTRNFEKWQILGVRLWPNYFVGDTYQEEIDFMKGWLRDRLLWMDSVIEKPVNAIKADANRQPLVFQLAQNYPNPFNPKTVIRYALPVTCHTDLVVYNLLGQKVATLVSERKQAGYHQVEWHADEFVSGFYFYRLQAGEYKAVKRCLLIK
jgi:hypothetical protein